MKKILFLLMIMFAFPLFAQQEADLFYFIDKKTEKFGIKDEKGTILFPAEFGNIRGFKEGQKLKSGLITLDFCPKNIKREKQTWGCVFDRKGNLLYQSFFYDNGPDYFQEGVRRFVKNGKVGFVDRDGKIIIPAQHDFVTPFNYGYAEFCDGCHWEKIDDEHRTVVGGVWKVMNFKGETIAPSSVQTDEKEMEINGKYYPYPFSYTKKEQKILQFFEKQNRLLADLEYVNLYNKLAENQKKLYFEIVERPTKNQPFYRILTYDYRKYNGLGEEEFLVSEDGKEIFHDDFFEEKTPFDQWLKEEIKQAKAYQKTHQDNPNKLRD